MSILTLLRYRNKSDRVLARSIHNIFGFYPRNLELYKLAFTHKSVSSKTAGYTISNERLEYLGDAVLSSIVAQFLFKKFPTKQEGFLTEMRSKIVSRSSLNKLSLKFGLHDFIHYSKKNEHCKFRSMGGNAFEAFTGALFLDFDYDFAYKIIVDRVIKLHIDLNELEKSENNYKSRLLEWAQKEKHLVNFKQIGSKGAGFDKHYVIQVLIDDKEYGKATDYSIKGAEQLAAEKTWLMMNE
ncbi:MAG: ribonuclease III [Bacteroidales bacterium]|nr:ribonuclease III [Bacteroidales bacterium]MBR2051496.1 ribonuclease III [Bacteroidales bacterium]